MTVLINCTKHPVTIASTTVAPSGNVALVIMNKEVLDSIVVDGVVVPVVRKIAGGIEGLPKPKDGVIYVVPAMVLPYTSDRGDVMAPNTDETAIRNDKGFVQSVVEVVVG